MRTPHNTKSQAPIKSKSTKTSCPRHTKKGEKGKNLENDTLEIQDSFGAARWLQLVGHSWSQVVNTN